MNITAWLHASWHLGWQRKQIVDVHNLQVTTSAAGWTGTITINNHDQFTLGDEIVIYNDDGSAIWAGKIRKRTYNEWENRYIYNVTGLGEHLLDLPFEIGYQTTEGRAVLPVGDLWRLELKKILGFYTPRYTTATDDYVDDLSGRWTPDFSGKRVGDLWRWFKAQYPVRIVPNLNDISGKITWQLAGYPDTTFIPPPEHNYTLEESIEEIATHIIQTPAAEQLLPQRSFESTLDANNTQWRVVPPGAGSFSITVDQEPITAYGYHGCRELSVTMTNNTFTGGWLGIETREKVSIVKGKTYVAGVYARGTNASLRILVNGTAGTTYNLTSDWREYAYQVTVSNADEVAVAVEVQPTNVTLDATARIDAPYFVLGTSALSEIAAVPFRTDLYKSIVDIKSSHYAGRITDVSGTLSSLTLKSYGVTFPTTIEGSVIDLFNHEMHWIGTVTDANNDDTITCNITTGTGTPPIGTPFRIRYTRIAGALAEAEWLYDVYFASLETQASPINTDELIKERSAPLVRLNLSCSPDRLPVIGQSIRNPQTGGELRIYEIGYTIANNTIIQINIAAGTPEQTLKSFWRQLTTRRQFQT